MALQDFLAAAAEEIEIDGEFAIDFADERQALAEPIVGRARLRTSSWSQKAGVFWLLRDVVFADVEAAQVFERQIDAAFGVVDA